MKNGTAFQLSVRREKDRCSMHPSSDMFFTCMGDGVIGESVHFQMLSICLCLKLFTHLWKSLQYFKTLEAEWRVTWSKLFTLSGSVTVHDDALLAVTGDSSLDSRNANCWITRFLKQPHDYGIKWGWHRSQFSLLYKNSHWSLCSRILLNASERNVNIFPVSSNGNSWFEFFPF